MKQYSKYDCLENYSHMPQIVWDEIIYVIKSEKGRRSCSDYQDANEYAKAVSGMLTEVNTTQNTERVIIDYNQS